MMKGVILERVPDIAFPAKPREGNISLTAS